MFRLNYYYTLLALVITSVANAQPSFRINSIISHRDLSTQQKEDIEMYAQGWAKAMLTDDAEMITEARRNLSDPFDERWKMSNTSRMYYGEALLLAFEPFFAKENENVMATANAIQVLSLLGTERGVTTLMQHASSNFEDRPAVRHWASAGLETSFKSGRLPLSRLEGAATLLADAASREPLWYVTSRQFQSLESLHRVPGLRRTEKLAIQALSMQLQASAISNIVEAISLEEGASDQMRGVRTALSLLRIQLIEPRIDSTLREDTITSMMPVLVRILQVAANHAKTARNSEYLISAYGGVIQTADAMLRRHAGGRDQNEVSLREAWESGDDLVLSEVIRHWQERVPKK